MMLSVQCVGRDVALFRVKVGIFDVNIRPDFVAGEHDPLETKQILSSGVERPNHSNLQTDAMPDEGGIPRLQGRFHEEFP